MSKSFIVKQFTYLKRTDMANDDAVLQRRIKIFIYSRK